VDPNHFFGHHVDPHTLGGKAVALILSVLLSGLVGLERQWRGQPAGLRTHILVGLGSTLITVTSVEFGAAGNNDPARLAAQIVSGIGFLGAGAIMRDGMTVHGLTTAASIWVVAAIGIAVGAGPRLGEVAVVATLIVLATLIMLNWLEDMLRLKQRVHVLHVEVKEADHGPARLLAMLAEQSILVEGVSFESGKASDAEPTRKMQIRVKLPRAFDHKRCLSLLANDASVLSFDLS
jgi:putative Mg2+ transporter-C (MgtC) family protein